ncbi:MAG: hypothetical protein ABI156_03565 [Caldimonas sp.]
MAYNRTQVRNLLSAAESDLFEASLAGNLKSLTGARLRSKIGRARALRDKYQDLLRRQKIATRGRTGSKLGDTGVANQRTEQKMAVLAEVLLRFEKRALQLEAAQVRATQKTSAAAARLARENERSARRRHAAEVPKVARVARSKSATPVEKPPPASATAKPRAARKTAGAVMREALVKKRAGEDGAGHSIGPTLSKKARVKMSTAPDQGGIGPTSESARATRFATQQRQSGAQRIQGHVGTQVRRAQAKRDSRG